MSSSLVYCYVYYVGIVLDPWSRYSPLGIIIPTDSPILSLCHLHRFITMPFSWHNFGFLSRYLVLGIIIPTDLLMSLFRLTTMPTMWFHVMSLSRHFFMSLSWFIRMPLFWHADRFSMEKPGLFLTFIPAVQRKSVHFCGFSPFLSSFYPFSSRGWMFYFILQRISMKMWKRERMKELNIGL